MDLPIHIIEKYLRGEANEEEILLVNDWFYSFDAENDAADEELVELRKQIGERIHSRLNKSIDATIRQEKGLRVRILRIAAAAVVVLSIGIYFLVQRSGIFSSKQLLAAKTIEKPIVTGNNKATLILADGKKIELDSAANGPIDNKNGMEVIKSEDGKVAYVPIDQPTGLSATAYNTIITPKGGQYCVTLSDGTKVWINAASSLRYPVAFNRDRREVELSGEGYFEVARMVSAQGRKIPFIVSVRQTGLPNDMKVNVLGTKFNVMAYGDEATIETTLLEGHVETVYSNNSASLLPGLQATLAKKVPAFKVAKADIQRALAWKNGEFRFNRMDIKGIMRQITRWYDVSVEYRGSMDQIYLSGVFSRQSDISKMLYILEATGTLHYQLEGNKIIVSTK